MIDPILLVPAALVLASICLPNYRLRRAGLAGVLVIQLAIASLELTGGSSAMREMLSPGYQAVSAALLIGGVLLMLSTAFTAIRSGQGSKPLMLAGAAILLVVAVQLGILLVPLAQGGGLVRTLAALALLASATVLLVMLVKVQAVKSAVWRIERIIAPPKNPGPGAPVPAGRPAMLGLHLTGILVALVAPNFPLLIAGVVLAMITGAIWEYQAGVGSRWPVGVIISGVALLAGSIVLLSVAGDTPLSLDQMIDGPFSEALQVMIAPVIVLAAWPLVRLWPLHGTRSGPAGALAGAAILIRVLAPVLPDGAMHWQPLFYLLLAIGAVYASVVRNDAVFGSSIAALGLLSAQSEAGWGGVAVLTAAIALQTLARATRTVPAALIGGRIILIAASLAVIPMLLGALQTEVFSTVIVIIGVVIGLLAGEDRRRVDRGPSLV